MIKHICKKNYYRFEIIKVDTDWCILYDGTSFSPYQIWYCPWCGVKLE